MSEQVGGRFNAILDEVREKLARQEAVAHEEPSMRWFLDGIAGATKVANGSKEFGLARRAALVRITVYALQALIRLDAAKVDAAKATG